MPAAANERKPETAAPSVMVPVPVVAVVTRVRFLSALGMGSSFDQGSGQLQYAVGLIELDLERVAAGHIDLAPVVPPADQVPVRRRRVVEHRIAELRDRAARSRIGHVVADELVGT